MINCANFFYNLSACKVLFFSLFGICWFVVVPDISNVSLPCHLEGMARPLAVTDRVAWEQLVKEVGGENWLEVFAVPWAARTQPRQVACSSYHSALLLCIGPGSQGSWVDLGFWRADGIARYWHAGGSSLQWGIKYIGVDQHGYKVWKRIGGFSASVQLCRT